MCGCFIESIPHTTHNTTQQHNKPQHNTQRTTQHNAQLFCSNLERSRKRGLSFSGELPVGLQYFEHVVHQEEAKLFRNSNIVRFVELDVWGFVVREGLTNCWKMTRVCMWFVVLLFRSSTNTHHTHTYHAHTHAHTTHTTPPHRLIETCQKQQVQPYPRYLTTTQLSEVCVVCCVLCCVLYVVLCCVLYVVLCCVLCCMLWLCVVCVVCCVCCVLCVVCVVLYVVHNNTTF